MERFGPGGNFAVKVVHLQRWSSLTGWSGPTENCRSVFRNCRFQSRFSWSLHTVVKMADGSDVSVYEGSVCKLQTQDLNFVLMYSCTKDSGTATHLNLFFLLVFISFQRQIYYGLLRMLTMFSRVFSSQYVTLALTTIPNNQFGRSFGKDAFRFLLISSSGL